MIQWRLILAAVVIAGAFFGGWQVNGWRWEAKLAEGERKAEADRIQLAQENAEIIAEYADQEAKIETRTKIIYRDIARISGPAQCIDDERMRFVERWNQIARSANGPDDGVRETGDTAR